MARKVFLSVLGTGFYDKYKYGIGDFCSETHTRFIQISTMEYLGVKEWNKDDAVYILMTDRARTENWETSETKMRKFKGNPPEEYLGLAEELENMHLSVSNKIDQDIPDGNNEEEMWKIFEKLYELIEDEDELYVDLTHSFRYIPMLMMVFCNYAKFLKRIVVKSITYGNIFSRHNDKENTATINDITSLSVLQDWTAASDEFISTGNVDKLSNIYLPELNKRIGDSKGEDKEAKALKAFINEINKTIKDIQTCQGKTLIEANNLKSLKKSIYRIKNIDKRQPFIPLFEQIEKSFVSFDTDNNIKNGITAAKWCLENGLYQQAVTLLQESLISYICINTDIDWQILKNRELVSCAIHIKVKRITDEDNWKVPQGVENGKQIIKKILHLPQIEGISKNFGLLTDLRNQFNHAAMLRTNQFSAEKLVQKIVSLTSLYYNETFLETSHTNSDGFHPMFINLSNHPSTLWETEQLQEASQYGEVRDLSFPQVPPDADETAINALAEEYERKILSMTDDVEHLTVHLMGEMTLTCSLVRRLAAQGINVVASTTRRETATLPDGRQVSAFKFIRFRKYM